MKKFIVGASLVVGISAMAKPNFVVILTVDQGYSQSGAWT